MSISINTATVATVATSQNSLASSASKQQAASVATAVQPVKLSAPDPIALEARLKKYLSALGTPLVLAKDAQKIAGALAPTMQSIVSERPDLANAHFDFQSNNGAIRVVSNSLNASDKAWIEGKLNGNASLVQAVQAFHDHAVAGYSTWSDANGLPLTKTQSAAINKKADDSFSFLNLFQSVGNLAERFKTVLSDYRTPAGQTVNFAQDPTSANGFLGFIKTAQAQLGNIGNIFELGPNATMPKFFPGADDVTNKQSLGLNKFA